MHPSIIAFAAVLLWQTIACAAPGGNSLRYDDDKHHLGFWPNGGWHAAGTEPVREDRFTPGSEVERFRNGTGEWAFTQCGPAGCSMRGRAVARTVVKAPRRVVRIFRRRERLAGR